MGLQGWSSPPLLCPGAGCQAQWVCGQLRCSGAAPWLRWVLSGSRMPKCWGGLGLAARARSESLGSGMRAQRCQWGWWDLGGTRGALGAPACVFGRCWCFCLSVWLACVCLGVCSCAVEELWVGGSPGGCAASRPRGPGCALSAVASACTPASPAPPSGCPWDARPRGSGSIWKVRAGAGVGGLAQSY